jgi:hypothetical protein
MAQAKDGNKTQPELLSILLFPENLSIVFLLKGVTN